MRDQFQMTAAGLSVNTEQNLQAVIDGTTQTVESFWERVGQIGQMPQVTVNGMQRAIADSVQTWLEVHPVVHWLVNHPIWGLILTVTSIFLLWGLLQAVADLTRQFWQILIRLPFMLGRWLSRQIVRLGVLVVDQVRSALLSRRKSPIWSQSHAATDAERNGDLSSTMPSSQIAVQRLLADATHQNHASDSQIIDSQTINSQIIDDATNHDHATGSATGIDAIDTAIANGALNNEAYVNSAQPEHLANSPDVVRLLHRLAELGQEQNQILRQIAALAKESAIAKK